MSIIETMAMAAMASFSNASETSVNWGDIITSALRKAEQAGWVLVPKEPTDPMRHAGGDVELNYEECWHTLGYIDASECYRLMLAAAPKVL